MALTGACELSSLLRVEDTERSELLRKHSSVSLIIKQQEGRLLYEIEEYQKCMEDTTRTFEKFQDQIAEVDMYEFKVIDDCEVNIIGYESSGKGFVERHSQSIREVIERWEHTDQLVSDAEELCGALHSIVLDGNVDQCIEDDDSESTADQQCAEDDRIQQMLLATRSALDDLAQQSELLDTSIRETAVALQELEASLGPQIAALESEVVQMKTDACKEDFAHSVELGKKTDAMNRASQQLREEQHTAQSIQGESSELRRALESLQQALSQQRDRERTAAEQYLSLDKETNALHETAAVAKERIAQLTSEVQSARCLIQTCEAQSFLERATTLLSDVTAAQEAGEAKTTELQYVQRQRAGEEEPVVSLTRSISAAATAFAHALGEYSVVERRAEAAATALAGNRERLRELQDSVTALHQQVAEQKDRLTVATEAHRSDFAAAGVGELEGDVDALLQDIEASQRQVERTSRAAHTTAARVETTRLALEAAQRQLAERESALRQALLTTEKAQRLASRRDTHERMHKQHLSELQRLLLEEDRQFQEKHTTAMQRREQRRTSLELDIKRLEKELAAAQRGEHAPQPIVDVRVTMKETKKPQSKGKKARKGQK